MKRYLMGRVSPVLLTGLVFGGYTYRDEMTWSLRGKGQFMVHEVSRFDKYFFSPTIGHSVGMAAALVVSLGIYELPAAVIVKATTSGNRR